MSIRWVRVGQIGVDSGIIRMSDPCGDEPWEPGPPQVSGGQVEFGVDDGGYDVWARIDDKGRVSIIRIDIAKWQKCELPAGDYEVRTYAGDPPETFSVTTPVGLW